MQHTWGITYSNSLNYHLVEKKKRKGGTERGREEGRKLSIVPKPLYILKGPDIRNSIATLGKSYQHVDKNHRKHFSYSSTQNDSREESWEFHLNSWPKSVPSVIHLIVFVSISALLMNVGIDHLSSFTWFLYFQMQSDNDHKNMT